MNHSWGNLLHHISNEVEFVPWTVGVCGTSGNLTRPFVHGAHSRHALLQGFAAGSLQLAHVGVGLAVAGAYLGTVAALAHSLGEALSRRVFALQRVPAGQVVRAPARFPLSARAHEAAAAAVRHVTARTARARARADVTALRTRLELWFGENRTPDVQHKRS